MGMERAGRMAGQGRAMSVLTMEAAAPRRRSLALPGHEGLGGEDPPRVMRWCSPREGG